MVQLAKIPECKSGLNVLLASCCALFAIASQASPSSKARLPPFKKPSPLQYSGCPAGSMLPAASSAIDFSQPSDGSLIASLPSLRIVSVFRYYDWRPVGSSSQRGRFGPRTAFNHGFKFPWRPGPQFAGKILTLHELQELHAHGIRVGVVFQHFNSDIRTFIDAARPAYDAKEAIAIASTLRQPRDTTIFFGVDFNAAADQYDLVRRYFTEVNRRLVEAGYRLGVYGNGLVCRRLQQDGLASACWLSQSVGFTESILLEKSGNWDVKQCATRRSVPGSTIEFDLDIVHRQTQAIFW